MILNAIILDTSVRIYFKISNHVHQERIKMLHQVLDAKFVHLVIIQAHMHHQVEHNAHKDLTDQMQTNLQFYVHLVHILQQDQ